MTEKSKEPCWYVVHTYSGYENKVKDTLEKSVENNGMQNLTSECLWRMSLKSKMASA